MILISSSSHRNARSFQAALRLEAQKMSSEINLYHEEIASNKEQIELVSQRWLHKNL